MQPIGRPVRRLIMTTSPFGVRTSIGCPSERNPHAAQTATNSGTNTLVVQGMIELEGTISRPPN
jgi:hypothetical protein